MCKPIISLFIITFITIIININSIAQETDTFIDIRDGLVYKTVKIKNQVWMAENLAFKTDSECWAYNDSVSNVANYGYLYSWETAQNVCPYGWHLPTKADFEILLNNYGGKSNEKANCTALIPNGESGFSASLGGWLTIDGFYTNVGNYGLFWSSSTVDDTNAWTLDINSTHKETYMYYAYRSSGLSIRCIQDN